MAAERRTRGRQLLRLWRIYSRMEAIWILRGGVEAAAWMVSDFLATLGGVTAIFLLAMRFDGIGGWSADQVVFMLGFALLARGLIDALFGWNIAHISRRIGRGQLDHSFVQPHPLWMTLFVEGFSPITGSTSALAGVGILAWATSRLGLSVDPLWLAAFAVNLAAAVGVLMAFAFAWGAAAFWAPRGAEEINSRTWSMIDSLAVFPLDGVGLFLQIQLITWLPAGLVAWAPARALTTPGGVDAGALMTPGLALILIAISFAIFRRGLKHYERVGSVRYLDWGFRR